MSNRPARNELIKIYGEICMLGEEITLENYITFHHIIKKCLKGKATVENGALLCRLMHQYLHIIENYYYGEYKYINEYLVYYKQTRDEFERQRMNGYVKELIK